MNALNPSHPRRRFLKLGAAAGAIVLGHLLPIESLRAAEMPKLEESDPTAKALQYLSNAAQSKTRTSPDQFCHNCLQYEGAGGAEWGPCKIFPGKLVHADGWCAAYVKRA